MKAKVQETEFTYTVQRLLTPLVLLQGGPVEHVVGNVLVLRVVGVYHVLTAQHRAERK